MTFKILTEFEIGQAMAAIEGVSRLGKPLSEVGCRVADVAEVEHDLLKCVEWAGQQGSVQPWIRCVGQHVRFGFYREPWVLRALDFVDRTDLESADRHWIYGLLFGYRPEAIQQFIARPHPMAPESSAHPTRTEHTVEMAALL